jgi:hypothetical protein
MIIRPEEKLIAMKFGADGLQIDLAEAIAEYREKIEKEFSYIMIRNMYNISYN